jgi:hypothetical protein
VKKIFGGSRSARCFRERGLFGKNKERGKSVNCRCRARPFSLCNFNFQKSIFLGCAERQKKILGFFRPQQSLQIFAEPAGTRKLAFAFMISHSRFRIHDFAFVISHS